MKNKIMDNFLNKARERLIFHEEDYKRKKKLKGKEIYLGKMRSAINQRKEIKQISKIWNKILTALLNNRDVNIGVK